MELLLANTGSYPRIAEGKEGQRLRQAYAKWERGELSAEAFGRVQDSVTEEVIQEQIEAGLDLVTDGQIRWSDPISHLAGKMEGVEIDGLLRFFDTNFYVRQPVIVGRVRRKGVLVMEEFRFAQGVSSRLVKPVLTGPYTLARWSILHTGRYGDLPELVLDFAAALGEEVKTLAGEGAALIQIDEPSILKHPEDLDLFREALEPLIRAKGSARLALYTYFGDAIPCYEAFQALPVEILGLDFTYSPALPEVISELGSEKILGLGLLDGRNTRLETKDVLFPILEQILSRLKGSMTYLNPSCGLEYLPREKALEKLRRMRELRDEFLNGGTP
ncbi:MAG: methylcobamide--CoM methyltransferase [candidate division NC10 bacterium]|nr:methylcobamide--CoM methyltransferase [candidate division NC10 bacterium]